MEMKKFLKKVAGSVALAFCLCLSVCTCFAETKSFNFKVVNGSSTVGGGSAQKSDNEQYGYITPTSVNNPGTAYGYICRSSNPTTRTGDMKLSQSTVNHTQTAKYNRTADKGKQYTVMGYYASGSTISMTISGRFTP